MNNQLAKAGDTIEWSFEDSAAYADMFRGKTFRSEVRSISSIGCYCVIAEYGQDYIPFHAAKAINRKVVDKKTEESTNYSNNNLKNLSIMIDVTEIKPISPHTKMPAPKQFFLIGYKLSENQFSYLPAILLEHCAPEDFYKHVRMMWFDGEYCPCIDIIKQPGNALGWAPIFNKIKTFTIEEKEE